MVVGNISTRSWEQSRRAKDTAGYSYNSASALKIWAKLTRVARFPDHQLNWFQQTY